MSKAGVIGSIIVGGVILTCLIGGIACTERVPAGYVAVQYSMKGGIKDEVLGQGWHIVSPTIKTKKFTIGNEQLVLSKDSRDGSKGNDAFSVSTSDNANINISFQMSYNFDESIITDTYKKFKGMDGEDIVNRRVRTVLKSKISEVTTNYSLMDIYSGNREEINFKITKALQKSLYSAYGINVIDASIVDVHPDEQLSKAIKQRVTALQKKQQAQAEQETAKVEAQTKLIKAQNKADIKITEAKAKAETRKIEANAEAEANKKIASSITKELIDMKEAEARLKHGWVTIQGGTPIVNSKN